MTKGTNNKSIIGHRDYGPGGYYLEIEFENSKPVGC